VTNFINILPHDTNQLKVAVKLGPVAATITTNNKVFQFYKGGIISSADCSKVETPVDSAVTIIGYGHDQHLNLEYWLIKNSWGTTWGDRGFARIAIT
jgi:C1A family cysteine protease